VVAEIEGTLEIDAPAGPFTLTARADRLERRRDGRVGVIDYKTGALPKARDVTAGLQPQLPLEAAIVAGGGFAELGALEVAELAYWELRDAGASKSPANVPVDELARAALDGLARLVAHYDQEATTYPARWVPPTVRFSGDYEHLARSQEWPE
jgi:ATP-dependent helicase/nuclease subunit B